MRLLAVPKDLRQAPLELETIEISQNIKHAASLPANHAGLGGNSHRTAGCRSETKRAMIFVLPHQVKVIVACNCGKSVAKSMENDWNPEL